MNISTISIIEGMAHHGKSIFCGNAEGGASFLSESSKRAFGAAFTATLPIFAGFIFLGIAYGIYMNVSGFGFFWPVLISLFVFAGSLQFVLVGLLLGPFEPFQALFITLMINARHLFYGISMLGRYSGTGFLKPYLIFGMCDETFSINCTAEIPPDVDRVRFLFFVTLLDHFYWVLGTALGGLFGTLIQFDARGLEFVMTALFVVIFIENWSKERAHYGSLLGLGLSVLSLVLFGRGNFIVPAMLLILAVLTMLQKPFQRAGAYR